MKRITHIITAILALALTGCTTVNTTSSDGATTTTREPDWNTINHMVKLAVKYATKAILDNNPDYTVSVDSINAGLSMLLVGSPGAEDLASAIQAFAPELSHADITTFAVVLKDAVDLYLAKSGQPLLAGNEQVQALVSALSEGIKEGITLHKAATRS
ncbi:MAG: hypothetical protein LBK99_21300 [Opitutaceae bacterium]|jgi:hypothetical protein|nr:hypothetical protein [Opitutaceae bacterium]